MPSEHDWDQREIEDFDWADRWNGRFVRAAAVGFPLWIWLLLVFGWLGGSPLGGMVAASLFATVGVLVVDRVATKRGGRWDDGLVRKALLVFMAAIVLVPLIAYIVWWAGSPGGAAIIVWGSLALLPLGGIAVALARPRDP